MPRPCEYGVMVGARADIPVAVELVVHVAADVNNTSSHIGQIFSAVPSSVYIEITCDKRNLQKSICSDGGRVLNSQSAWVAVA